MREALPRHERTGSRPVAAVTKAQLPGHVVGDAEAGQGGEKGTEAGGVAVAMVGGVDVRIAKVPVRRHTVAEPGHRGAEWRREGGEV